MGPKIGTYLSMMKFMQVQSRKWHISCGEFNGCIKFRSEFLTGPKNWGPEGLIGYALLKFIEQAPIAMTRSLGLANAGSDVILAFPEADAEPLTGALTGPAQVSELAEAPQLAQSTEMIDDTAPDDSGNDVVVPGPEAG